MPENQEKVSETLTIGNCQCIDKYVKHFILSVFDKKIDDEKNNIKRVENNKDFYIERSKHSSQYYTANELIEMYRQNIKTTELIRRRVENTQECQPDH